LALIIVWVAASLSTVKVTEPVAAPALALAETVVEELEAFAGAHAVALVRASAADWRVEKVLFTVR
jgi:hypothetical protein